MLLKDKEIFVLLNNSYNSSTHQIYANAIDRKMCIIPIIHNNEKLCKHSPHKLLCKQKLLESHGYGIA